MSDQRPIEKCGDCGQISHNSTACNNGKVGVIDLFGVRIDPTAHQSEDDGYLQVVNGVCSSNYESKSKELVLKMHNNELGPSINLEYLSDEHNNDKKKGMPWTEDEHRSFLTGLEQLGRGHWRAISKHYVPSRTPTQVASHAQKFFIRLNSTEDKRKRRSSLFDMPLDEYSSAPGASVRPSVVPMSRTYGVEGCNRLPDVIEYERNDQIPSVKYMIEESVHPLDRQTEQFGTLVSRPLPITNGERRNTQEPQVEKTKD